MRSPFTRPFPNFVFWCIFVRPLAHFWLPFVSRWFPFGSRWLTFGSVLAPFGLLLVPLGSFLLAFDLNFLNFGISLHEFLYVSIFSMTILWKNTCFFYNCCIIHGFVYPKDFLTSRFLFSKARCGYIAVGNWDRAQKLSQNQRRPFFQHQNST